jgi:hypothetical protein
MAGSGTGASDSDERARLDEGQIARRVDEFLQIPTGLENQIEASCCASVGAGALPSMSCA